MKASGLDDAALPATVERVFDQMADEVDWPDQVANQIYLVAMVHRGFLATGDAQRRLFVLLMRTRLGARLLLRTLRPNWLGLTPAPANQWTITRPEPGRVHIEVSRCYRLDAFRQLGTPEVAFIACYFEGYVMDVSPHIRVTWIGMATGAERCRHHFELLGRGDRQPVASETYLRPPVAS